MTLHGYRAGEYKHENESLQRLGLLKDRCARLATLEMCIYKDRWLSEDTLREVDERIPTFPRWGES